MKILITGGAGFIGQRLAKALLERGELNGKPIDEIVLLDITLPGDAALTNHARVRAAKGDISDRAVLESYIDDRTEAVFHLAAIVSGQAEADFDLGMKINLDASRALLEVCHAKGHKPRVVFTSSVAVYGGTLPDVVQDDTALNPQSSYGTQKAIAELLLCDYTRRGYIDGRVLRLPTISVRPGKPNAAASSFASGIIREPLKGERSTCPVDGATRVWLLSPRGAVEALIAGCEIDRAKLGNRPVLNLPGLSVSVNEMIEALREVAGEDTMKLIDFQRDERIEKIVSTWPGAWNTARAEQLGLTGDKNFADVIRAFIDENRS
ncbi:NAD-dependent epimerase/dehydratase [Caballeronia hypogeia]|uniref:NAD-dependent epimerase/dehydratase n=1 Tax=Caballeronia hypogeia TaxID=1777140 RepID=A0A158D8L1_9BURK|nr:D-erythronate dehydrogenase [Caballeronia hypogeia]SAK90995.1 NAD-dependent epimerase/dehydratase [Caballeronia hypogeia]